MPTSFPVPLVPRLCPLDLESALAPPEEKELLPVWSVALDPLEVLPGGTREMLFALEGSCTGSITYKVAT